MGYIFLVLTILFYISLTLFKPAVGQNDAIGGLLMVAFYGIGIISSLILTISVARQDGFDWISDQSVTRNLVVGIGWACMTVATLACAAFKWEWHPGEFPEFLHWLAKTNAQIALTLMMLVPFFILLNPSLRAGISPNIYKIPLMMGVVLSAFIVLILLSSYFKIISQQHKAAQKWAQKRDRKAQQGLLGYIIDQTNTDPIVNILAYTGRSQEEDVRSAAITKIKERPDWEKDIIQLLDEDYNYNHDVYTFLDAHEVAHPEKFLQPINSSILRLADEIQTYIKQSQTLEASTFEGYGIERRLRVIDEQFADKGLDFRPAILKLQAALATERLRVDNKNVQFDDQKLVNDWLEKYKSQ